MLCAAEQMYFGCDNGPKPACGTRPTNFCDDDALWLLVFTRLSVSSYASDFESLAHGYDICWEGAGCISPSSTLKTLRRISYPFSNQAILNGLESLRVGVSRQKAKVPVNSSENVQNDEFSTGKFGDGKVANNNMATDIKLKILQKKKKDISRVHITNELHVYESTRYMIAGPFNSHRERSAWKGKAFSMDRRARRRNEVKWRGRHLSTINVCRWGYSEEEKNMKIEK